MLMTSLSPALHPYHNLFKNLPTRTIQTQRLGQAQNFLGLEIARDTKGIMLSQRHYTLQLLKDTGFLTSKPTTVPMDPKAHLNATDGEVLTDISQYLRLIGRLLYLSLSRPNIAFAVHKFSQFIAQPQTPHLHAVYNS